jgi:hypothetical protein
MLRERHNARKCRRDPLLPQRTPAYPAAREVSREWAFAGYAMKARVLCAGFGLGVALYSGHALADAISDNLNVVRMSPPLSSYSPGTIARGHYDKRTYERTGEKLLKVNVVRCRAPFDKDGFEENLEGASFTSHDSMSFGLSGGWANILNAAFNGSYVNGVSLTFTGTIYEYPETKLEALRVSCLGSKNPKGDTGRFQFQIVRLAVGRFEYTIDYKANASASLKANIANKLAAELGFSGGVGREGTVIIPRGAMAYPLWRENW